MKVIGLLGGIGSGKSTVAQAFADHGAALIDADQLGHEVLQRDDIRRAVRARWGSPVFDGNGWIDRNKLAKIVFATSPDGKQALSELEALTHPCIREAFLERLARFRSCQISLVILDAPLLLRAGWDPWCDVLVFVDCPWEQRVARVAKRGWDAEELQRRENAQESLSEKRARCDVIIDNSQSLEHTRDQVEMLVRQWSQPASESSAL